MCNHIIEYIGKEGVKTTPLDIRRLQGPKPGDPVLFNDDAGYPYISSLSSKNAPHYGRIASIDNDTISICCGGASVFLYDNGNVSISGGPFASVTRDKLKFTFRFKQVRFWNWGDNFAGANQGVYYSIDRPIWELSTD